jgi:dienelactone hydrolase
MESSSSTQATSSAAVERFGAYAYWPENLGWSFQLIRLIGEATVGGADFSEVHGVARELTAGDIEGWYEGFNALAKKLDAEAGKARDAGHLVTARESWLRASNYYRAAAFFHPLRDPRVPQATDDRRRTFQAAARYSTLPIETVEIPYESSSLPAYVLSPAERSKPTPGVIIFGGTDAIAEEMYLHVGKSLAERGYTVLAMDGPGQGEALRRGITARVDYEVPVAAAVDFLEARDDVDRERIALLGQSLGGYYAGRAGAFEKRLKALVIWGAFYGVDPGAREEVEDAERVIDTLQTIWGAGSEEELMEILGRATLAGVAEKIECPTLVMHAEGDSLVPFSHAQRTYDDIQHADKELIVYPIGAAGCTHCQVDSLPTAQCDIGNWLDRRLGR